MSTTKLLWFIFFALLAVLMPHTAWLFYQFEQPGKMGIIIAACAAIAFEAAIAVLTHKLSIRLSERPKSKKNIAKFVYHWLNAYSFGLAISVGVSSLANLAHAVQFGQTLAIFDQWGIRPAVYQISFGAILPAVSLLFAKVLSNSAESEDEPDPALVEAKGVITDIRAKLRESEKASIDLRQQLSVTEQARHDAEARFNAAGDIMRALFDQSQDAKARIIAIYNQWPALPQTAIAVMTDASPAHVSETLKQLRG